MTRLCKCYFNIKCSLMNKKGQSMVEYILIIAFIGLMLITVLSQVGGAIETKFDEIKDLI